MEVAPFRAPFESLFRAAAEGRGCLGVDGFILVWAAAVGVFTVGFTVAFTVDEVDRFGCAVFAGAFAFTGGQGLSFTPVFKTAERTATPALTCPTAHTNPASSRASAVTIFVPVFFRSCIARHFLRSLRSARSAIAMTSSETPARRSVNAALATKGALK